MSNTYMNCGVCGHAVSGDSAQCPKCGSALPASPRSVIGPQTVAVVDTRRDEHDRTTAVHLSEPLTGWPGEAATIGPGDASQPRQPNRPRSSFTEVGPLAEGEAFGPRYHIIRMLGIGGMGAVYQAWDEELGVAVAIKVIRPEVMQDPFAAAEVERRFKRELLLARQVTHKNVVRIHDIGVINDIRYITMAYVKGTDLATRLTHETRLPATVVLPIARAVVSGLIAAHHAGVVHRDLKPANIMISDEGEALIMDFGIARSAGGRATLPSQDVARPATATGPVTRIVEATRLGVIVGTIEYMSPEQGRGVAVDQRSDIYSLGLILYDALTGRVRSMSALSAVEELQARMAKAPPSIMSVLPETPDALASLITKCLEPDPAQRFQTTEELAAALDRIDDRGELIPVKRVVDMRLLAAVVVLAIALSGGVWYVARTSVPPPPHDPVSVVIADFQNNTGDASLERALEPALKLALEDAGFISAFDRSQMATLGVTNLTGPLDEAVARQVAVSEGLGIVVSGAVDRQGQGYKVSVKAIQSVAGDAVTTAETTVARKDQVMGAVTLLAARLRSALGDETPESAKMFAMETLTATSLDVIHEYALATEALANGKNRDALDHGAKAAKIDPGFGSAYGLMAAAAEGIGQHQEAQTFIQQGLARLDRVTERERYRIRGLSFLLTGDRAKCVEEYRELVRRYPSDTSAHNNLALCAKQLRDMPTAIDEMQKAVAILPKRARFRGNLALNAVYGGDFAMGEREAQESLTLNPSYPTAFSALAFAQLGQARLGEAADTYGRLEPISPPIAASGFGDLALYQGRLREAVDIFERGAAADLAAKSPDRAAEKLVALAYTHLTRGQHDRAIAAAERALATGSAVKIKFLAGRILAEGGAVDRAREMAASLSSQLQAEPRAYAKIIEGDLALKGGRAGEAVDRLTESIKLVDTWIGRFDLGRAYFAAAAYTQADSEFDRCIARRGEAMALFLDAEPTYGYLPPVYYYQGRVREGLKTAGYTDSYKTFLDIRSAAGEDPLLADVRKRVGS